MVLRWWRLGVVVLHDLDADALAKVRPPPSLVGLRPWIALVGLSDDGNDDRPLVRFAELESCPRELLGTVGRLEPLRRDHDHGRCGAAAAARVAPAVDRRFGIEAAV